MRETNNEFMEEKDLLETEEDIELDEEEIDSDEDFDSDDYNEDDEELDYDESDEGTEGEEENKVSLSKLDYTNLAALNLPASLIHLINGYVDYAKEVVVDRAIPGIDGLKPSQRRVLYVMKFIEKVTDLRKCANVAGATMKIHPHGDASIYDTMVRMVGSSLHLNVPYLKGKGSFGNVFSSDAKPAAARYTECKLEEVTEELFKGMSGVELIPSYDNKYKEPVLLPVSFPSILCNPAQGIAVGIAANIPAFNFHEVIKATIELIETGEIKKPLAPDFTTGGCCVYNERELQKLMATGNAKLKLRGKWHIEGKVIVIDEIPYYTTVEEIAKAVKDLPNVADVKDESDKRGLRLTIECSTRKVVDEVLQEVLRISPLQMTLNTNIVVIVNNQPEVVGVKQVLNHWLTFREGVVSKELQHKIKEVSYQIEQYDILVDLMTTESKREPFLALLMKEGRQPSKELLREYYPDAKEDIFDWILEKSIGSLSGIGNKQKSYLIELREKKEQLIQDSGRVRELIVEELKAINKKYKFPRKTEITEVDYVFEELKGSKKKKAEAVPVIVIVDGKFIKKLKNTPTNQKLDGAIKCMSDDTISLLDNRGRLIRVQVEHLDFVTEREKGTYIPLYLGEEDDKYSILDIEVIKDKKIGYMYKDGYAAIIDFNEWYSAKRKTKLTPDGLAPKFIDLYLGNFRMDRPYIIFLTKKGKLGITTTTFLEKSRRARTKLIHVGKGDEIVKLCSASEKDLEDCIANKERFMNCFRVITKADGYSQEVFDRLSNKNNSLLG